jgi:hypothetical protein
MNNRQENKLTMFIIIRDFLLLPASAAITMKWAAFAAMFTNFTNLIELIKTTAAKQDEDRTGMTMNKGAIRKQLEAIMEYISEQGRAYAKVAKDFDFLKKVKFMKGELKRASDEALVNMARTLCANISEKLAAIKAYDLVDADMDELETLTGQFENIYSKPQAETKETVVETDKLDPLFAQCDAELETIDALVLTKKRNAPGFVAEYFAKRKIDNQGRRKRSLQIHAEDFDSGEPLAKVVISYKKKGQTEMTKSVKRTGSAGNTFGNNTGAGDYTGEATKFGYDTELLNFSVNDGELTKVVVRMKKNGQ